MVHIALRRLCGDPVEHLIIRDGAERAGGQNLSLAARKHAGTVDAGQQADLGGERTHLIHTAAVDALLILSLIHI